jgi:hypothetical protein
MSNTASENGLNEKWRPSNLLRVQGAPTRVAWTTTRVLVMAADGMETPAATERDQLLESEQQRLRRGN